MKKINDHKYRIAQSFNAAVHTYAEFSTLQKNIGHTLLSYSSISLSGGVVLDVGASVGYFSKVLQDHFKKSQVISVDIADQLLYQSETPAICADFDYLPFLNESIDLLYSNMAFQWSLQLGVTLQESARVLKPGGILIFSTLMQNSFFELRDSLLSIDRKEHLNIFPMKKEMMDYLNPFFKVSVTQKKYQLYYDTVLSMMRHFKKIGANYVMSHHPRPFLKKSNIQQLENAYARYKNAEGQLPVTYDVVFCHCIKR